VKVKRMVDTALYPHEQVFCFLYVNSDFIIYMVIGIIGCYFAYHIALSNLGVQ
jgi:Sec-independent protein secretion pathway component TatC